MRKIIVFTLLVSSFQLLIAKTANELSPEEQNAIHVGLLSFELTEIQSVHWYMIGETVFSDGKFSYVELITKTPYMYSISGLPYNLQKIYFEKENNVISKILFSLPDLKDPSSIDVSWEKGRISSYKYNRNNYDLDYDNQGRVVKADKGQEGFYLIEYIGNSTQVKAIEYRRNYYDKKSKKFSHDFKANYKVIEQKEEVINIVVSDYMLKRKEKGKDELYMKRSVDYYSKDNVYYTNTTLEVEGQNNKAEIHVDKNQNVVKDSLLITDLKGKKIKSITKYNIYDDKQQVIKNTTYTRDFVDGTTMYTVSDITYKDGVKHNKDHIVWYNSEGVIIKERENVDKTYRIKENGQSWGSWKKWTY